ncbi:DNA polymerase III subunit delta [Pseudobacteriovorax antillogorgiicola]|uniref:DNA-directed DNA polymerase n=1 Tax=Pseudobacteriovorax antillogorgiicola TaxID=1513793 RepID=A0A1Y6B3C8_9BACT|nr:DNA polymerase III subunit delta [Pseudobacteriovorax antillogorgiicola]TCS59326.1 DNA polymerase III delta subunit [Pseudobacteriovorax antillogorgiicola]SME89358.1 DNA polymerase III, delta subunit [Pseudobacteriovorax antillogorgiicola]
MKKNNLTYKHFIEALKEASKADSPKLLAVHGPSNYLKIKVEEWFTKQAAGRPVEKRGFDGLIKADYEDMLFQDSIFDPESYYVVRDVDKKGELTQALRGTKSQDSIRNHVLLLAKGKSFNPSLNKELQRLQVKTIPCFEPNPYEMSTFTVSLAKKFQLKIAPPTAKLVIDAVGTDLFKLENELRKLSLIFAEEPGEISVDHLKPYLEVLREEHAFKIDQCIMSGHAAQGQALLHNLLKRGESHLAILGILTHHCRKALLIKQLAKEGKQVKEMSQALGLPFGVVKNFIPYARRSSAAKFKSALFQCQEADMIFKSSRIQSELILSDILATLAQD